MVLRDLIVLSSGCKTRISSASSRTGKIWRDRQDLASEEEAGRDLIILSSGARFLSLLLPEPRRAQPLRLLLRARLVKSNQIK